MNYGNFYGKFTWAFFGVTFSLFLSRALSAHFFTCGGFVQFPKDIRLNILYGVLFASISLT